jgi:hypothetical protein
VTFGDTVALTARVAAGPAHAQVLILGTRVGGRKVLVKQGAVDAWGLMSVRVAPRATTTYVAKFAGSKTWLASSSDTKQVAVAGRWTAKNVGGYATSGRYRLYHYTTACTGTNPEACPREYFSLAPKPAYERAVFHFQSFYRGRWHGQSYVWKLSRRSNLMVFTWYQTRDIIGVPHRVRVHFVGDTDHSKAFSKWLYWKVTN